MLEQLITTTAIPHGRNLSSKRIRIKKKGRDDKMTQDQTVYSIVITDNQDYWDWRTDYLGTAKNVEQAKQMLKDWIIKHNFSKEGNILDDDLAHSIGIFE